MNQSSASSSARLGIAREEILKAAPASEDAAKRADDLIKDAQGVTSAIGRATIIELVEDGLLHRAGTGRRNDAYRYWTLGLINAESSLGEDGVQVQDPEVGASDDVRSVGSSTGNGINTFRGRTITQARARLGSSLPHITDRTVKTVGFLGVLGGLVFAIVYIVNTVDPCFFKPCPPKVTNVSPTEVSPGEEVDVSGTRLDLVEEVQLRKGVLVESLFIMPLSETGMLLAVPNGVVPEEYILEIRERGNEEFATTEHMVVVKLPGPKNGGGTGHTIFFANLDWDTARLQNAVAKYIIEKGYDNYRTESFPDVPGQPKDIWQSLLTGGIQVQMEVWLPNQLEEWEEALARGSVIPLGKSLDLNWQSAFVVPT